ncbi:DUF1338 domain-containing protein [Fusarium falciforme]|uniref:DUF1338 domain-containing protein n=1 Tax=Fusarium falciforme TaxID=195108 RepID=UPI0023016ED5|nr:DUF1338 domain-containing protein [Fusarium falciforme]WAO93375.1 DUF1338 domain-containing protein [Fusarium falciforme]
MSTITMGSTTAGGAPYGSAEPFMDPNDVRTAFTVAMSAMYRNEVPLYGDLIRIVQSINKEVLSAKSQLADQTGIGESAVPQRLDLERHGAIRLGTPYELRTVSRIFAVIGLKAVGYYDLSIAGLPMHATCFRPIDLASLNKNPFRVFTTLLRPELLSDKEARDLATKLLTRRNIFSSRLLDLTSTAEGQSNRLTASQAEEFILEAMKTFSWRPEASATEDEYKALAAEHPILADIASFKSSHINHLTPRTLDIVASQERMKVEGLKVKNRIEGPPRRQCPILLRQTSFLALEERIKFRNSEGTLVEGTHRARFGEIEERGAAVTPAGRKLYDALLEKAMDKCQALSCNKKPALMDELLSEVFREYPDTWTELRRRELVYCTYRRTRKPLSKDPSKMPSLEDLVSQGYLEAEPITYEDFLPFSAAGIFQSNLTSSKGSSLCKMGRPDQEGYEKALGGALLSADDLYLKSQRESIEKCGLGSG